MRKRQKLTIALLATILFIALILIFIIKSKTVYAPTPMSTSTNEKQFVVVSEEIISTFKQLEYKENLSIEELNIEICNLQFYKTELDNMYLNYPKELSAEINELVSSEINTVDSLLEKYQIDLEYARVWKQRAQEYPTATQIWLSMKEQGCNDYVRAGILGNMMAECSGHTLNIQWDSYDCSGWFYGICQWSIYYSQKHQDCL